MSRRWPGGGRRYDRVVTLPRILSAAGRTLAVLGAVMLLFVAFELWGTGLQQAQAQENLEGDFAERFRRAAAAGQGAPSPRTGADPPAPEPPATDPALGVAAARPAAPVGEVDPPAAGASQDGNGASESAGAASQEDPAVAPPEPESLPEYPALPYVVRHVSETAGARSVARLLDPEVEDLLPLVYPDAGEAVARLAIPSIDVDEIVVTGVEVEDLRKGPGHYRTTPLPGQPGNAAIAGHRTTYGAPFGRLNELAPGDEIIVETLQGTFVYRVLPGGSAFAGRTPGHRIVAPTALEVLDDHGDNRLTLTSCHPKYSSRQRIIVHAALVGDPVVRLPRPGEPIGAEFVESADPPDPPEGPTGAASADDQGPAATPGSGTGTGTGTGDMPAEGTDPGTAGALSDAAVTTGDTGAAEPSDAAPASEERPAVATGDETPERVRSVPDDGFGEGLSGDRDAIAPAVLWGLAAIAVWVLGRAFGRQGRRVQTYAIAAVPFLVVLYVTFTYIDRALPAY